MKTFDATTRIYGSTIGLFNAPPAPRWWWCLYRDVCYIFKSVIWQICEYPEMPISNLIKDEYLGAKKKLLVDRP